MALSGTAVFDQLVEDFPKDAARWVLHLKWDGPKDVPLDQIDYSNKDSWHASKDPDHVAVMVKKIKSGEKKPIILVSRKGKKKLMVVDGHHRALAYLKLKLPARAYVAQVPDISGPWDEMHAAQDNGKSG